jgi:hypothetical protein
MSAKLAIIDPDGEGDDFVPHRSKLCARIRLFTGDGIDRAALP